MALLSDGVISDCSITKIWERFNYYIQLGSRRYKSMPKGPENHPTSLSQSGFFPFVNWGGNKEKNEKAMSVPFYLPLC